MFHSSDRSTTLEWWFSRDAAVQLKLCSRAACPNSRILLRWMTMAKLRLAGCLDLVVKQQYAGQMFNFPPAPFVSLNNRCCFVIEFIRFFLLPNSMTYEVWVTTLAASWLVTSPFACVSPIEHGRLLLLYRDGTLLAPYGPALWRSTVRTARTCWWTFPTESTLQHI